MLVMRNFGYLGLHSVVHSKSSLARNRLVDFTGEMQIRRRGESDGDQENIPSDFAKRPEDTHVVPEWHKDFVSEPTVNGGRNLQDDDSDIYHLYAQELAPLPLQATPSTRSSVASPHSGLTSPRGRANSSADDIEPYYHTSFCNELFCHPRLLHNCPKGNIVIKVEMREMEWKAEYNAYFAHLPERGPALHNPRRGPFLVQGAYTSCARCLDPHFLDEFKLKLPLILTASTGDDSKKEASLLFTVYRLSFSSRKRWSRRLLGSKRTGSKIDEIAGDLTGEGSDEMDSSKDCRLIQLACGHLSLASNRSIIRNGNHDVKMVFTARNPRRELVEKGDMEESTLIISEMSETKNATDIDSSDRYGEDSESVASGALNADTASVTSASDSVAMSESTEDRRVRSLRKNTGMDRISLQVRFFVHVAT